MMVKMSDKQQPHEDDEDTNTRWKDIDWGDDE